MSAALRYAGESEDGRTNRWSVTPDCGHKAFEPKTTRMSQQIVSCPKCGKEWLADYNSQTISEAVL